MLIVRLKIYVRYSLVNNFVNISENNYLERVKRSVYFNSFLVFHRINIFIFNRHPRKRFLFFRINDRSLVYSEMNFPSSCQCEKLKLNLNSKNCRFFLDRSKSSIHLTRFFLMDKDDKIYPSCNVSPNGTSNVVTGSKTPS